MKRFIFILSAFVTLFLLTGKNSYAQVPKRNIPKQFIVVFKKQPKATDLIAISKSRKKSKIKYAITESKAIVFEPASVDDIQGAIEELKKDPNVENVIPDGELQLLYVPNDPAINAVPNPGKPNMQWGMFNLNLAGNGRSAWDVSKGSSQTVVAVLDSGIDSSHEDFAGKLVSLYDCSSGSCNSLSAMTADGNNQDDSHGTHVAGIIGAGTDNNIGVTGAGFNSRMMIIRLRNAQGIMSISSFINGIRFAADQGVDIINMSLGALEGNLDPLIISEITSAVAYAWNKNVLLVAAAGNCGWDTSHHNSSGDPCDIYDTNGNFLRHGVNEKFYPAASPNVLSVAALDINNQLAAYSEYNDATKPTIGNWISVAAPGGMFSTNADKENGIASTWPGSSYFYSLGTSSASPHVAGIAALILAHKPALTNAQLKTIIEQTANPAIISGKTKFGMVNALSALDSLSNSPTPGASSPTPIRTPTKTPTPGMQLSITPTRTVTPTIPVISLTPPASGCIAFYTAQSCSSLCASYYSSYSCNGLWCCPPAVSTVPTISGQAKEGDANNDNRVDGADYVIWRNNFEKPLTGASFGDFNSSGRVDGVDYVFWLRNYGT